MTTASVLMYLYKWTVRCKFCCLVRAEECELHCAFRLTPCHRQYGSKPPFAQTSLFEIDPSARGIATAQSSRMAVTRAVKES